MLVYVPLGGVCGVIIGLLLGTLLPASISDALGAPALWAFEQWQDFGLPPEGEGALAGPYLAELVEWGIFGIAVTICWRYRRRKKHDGTT